MTEGSNRGRDSGVRRLALDVALGVAVAVLTWWLVDLTTRPQAQQTLVAVGDDAIELMERGWWVLPVVLVATVVLAFRPAALLTAGLVLVAGIAVGSVSAGSFPGLGPSEALRALPPVVLRGANEPAMLALAGAWLAVGAVTLVRRDPGQRAGRA